MLSMLRKAFSKGEPWGLATRPLPSTGSGRGLGLGTGLAEAVIDSAVPELPAVPEFVEGTSRMLPPPPAPRGDQALGQQAGLEAFVGGGVQPQQLAGLGVAE